VPAHFERKYEINRRETQGREQEGQECQEEKGEEGEKEVKDETHHAELSTLQP